ncbi:putative choline kinase 2 [Artemisia annua]|uniref:Putative choline kinase 2 n=1 Tax=Artemisia annua TaxID=35608 RepID=A0A2U1NMS6_ARTAN|nr:putative choline kinase 2 [Artemisia annua]
MIEDETRTITLIDYEYASYNTVAYDLGNHFCEMAANYHTNTPHVLDYNVYPGGFGNIYKEKLDVVAYPKTGSLTNQQQEEWLFKMRIMGEQMQMIDMSLEPWKMSSPYNLNQRELEEPEDATKGREVFNEKPTPEEPEELEDATMKVCYNIAS